MRRPPEPGFLLVERREWRWLLQDRVALILIFGVPLCDFAFLTAPSVHPVIRGLGCRRRRGPSETRAPSLEQGAVSTGISIGEARRHLAAAAAARDSAQAMPFAAIYVPAIERDMKARAPPAVVEFYNQQFHGRGHSRRRGISGQPRGRRTQVAKRPNAAPTCVPLGSAGRRETIVLVNPQRRTTHSSDSRDVPGIVHLRSWRWRRLRGGLRVPPP